MTDKKPTIQEVYAQIKASPGAYAELMNLPDHDALVDRLVKICHAAGRTDITAVKMEQFIDRDLGEVLHELHGEELELTAGENLM